MNPTYKLNWLADTLRKALGEVLGHTSDYNDIMASYKQRCDGVIAMYKKGYNLEYETAIEIFAIYKDSLSLNKKKGD